MFMIYLNINILYVSILLFFSYNIKINMGYQWKSSTSTDIPPKSAFEVMGQLNKIKGITFRATLIYKQLSKNWG